MAALDPGTPFPPIALRDEKDRRAPLPKGETLYAFFKTACPTSEFSWPYLDRIRSVGEGGGLSVLAVSQDDPETTARFNARLGVALATAYDARPWTASAAMGLTNVPTFFLVGRDGVIRDTVVGFQRHKMEELAARAADLAGRPARPLFSQDENVPAIKPG